MHWQRHEGCEELEREDFSNCLIVLQHSPRNQALLVWSCIPFRQGTCSFGQVWAPVPWTRDLARLMVHHLYFLVDAHRANGGVGQKRD
jgi:hypothetical protein